MNLPAHTGLATRRDVLTGLGATAVLLSGLRFGRAAADPVAAPGTQPLSLLGGSMTGRFRLTTDPLPGSPLLVFIHGGGSSSAETDVPGHSQLELAAAQGLSAFAPDRPGYGGSTSLNFPPGSDDGLFEANAARLDDAITEIWNTHGNPAGGIVVHGSSIGGAIALTLAARWSAAAATGTQRWPLRALGVADVGQVPRPYTAGIWNALPPIQSLTFGDIALVRPELLEISGAWPRANWSRVSSAITVPVHYRLARNDQLWVETDELVGQFADTLRTHAPKVDAAVTDNATHPIAKSPAADAYNADFMRFVHDSLA
ncbi:alpha/beta fold hydrolase [Nocardia sp. NBC_01327]|uniref:alpha/beta fold hydrolase n=1 Tax=Nocardia sp. NBC_01327 TaxID=2903593 RepID=UPI002E0D8A7A|nr:alpha/beta hydrolase [Nocardia sp. NBC_01327]